MVKYIVGHKNPDSDSVCSAIAYSYLKNELGEVTTPVIQGAINPETEFILNKFNVDIPELISDATDKELILVDHSDISQSVENVLKGTIYEIIDHHKLGDITTPSPLEMWVWPVGCTCTILTTLFNNNKIAIPKNIAGLLLSAILSDTVIFKSPTCTDKDKAAVAELAKLAEINNIEEYGMDLFKAKSAVDGVSAKDLVFRDYKDFDMNGNKVGIGQLEVVDLTVFDSMTDDLMAALKEVKEDGRHSAFLVLTDIMNEGSKVLYVSESEDILVKTFNTKSNESGEWLPGVMSRKKQVAPELIKYFSN